MGRFTNFLVDLLPRTGRVIKEDGSIFNEADLSSFQRDYSSEYQAVNNGATVFSARFTIPEVAPYYIALDVPVDRALVLFSRQLNVSQGRYEIDVINGTDQGGGSSANVAKTTLRKGVTPTVQTNLVIGTNAPTGITVAEYGFLDTGTAQTGQARVGGAVGIDGVLKVFTGKSWLRIDKTDAGTGTGNIVLIAWELDAADLPVVP